MKITDGWLDEAIEANYLSKSMDRQGQKPKYLVLHGTAGGSSAQGIAKYFEGTVPASSHFIIGQDGAIVQGVPCSLAAWANGALTTGHAPYLPNSINPNLYTISIEHVKSSLDNSDALTPAQTQASFELIKCLCEAYGIPKRKGDASGGIISHADIDPVNRARCPGPYPWETLWTFLKGAPMIPNAWKDDGTTLIAPNGHKVVRGFRAYILSHNWEVTNVPLQEEESANPIEEYYQSDAGTRQLFNFCELAWTKDRGVYLIGVGNELRGARAARDKALSDLKLAQVTIAVLQGNQPIDDLRQIAQIANKYQN